MESKSPHRKNIRIKEYDYSKIGYYFITICTKNRECILAKIYEDDDNVRLVLSKPGIIIDKNIKEIERIYHNIKIDEYAIMPNHIHIILIINEKEESKSISKVMQQFKRISTIQIGNEVWQKSFYEHIIRNEKEYLKIKEYIINNPINWKRDKYF